MYKRICGILLIIVSCACGISMPTSALEAESQIIFISEIRISGQTEPKEYVELLNSSDEIIDLSSYYLEYAKPTFDSDYCSELDWKRAADENNLGKVINIATLTDITIQPRGKVYVGLSMNNDVAGAVKLVKVNDTVITTIDLVGWGSIESPPPCSKGLPAEVPVKGSVLKRILDEDGMPILATNNEQEFIVSQIPTPTVDQCPLSNPCDEEPAEEPDPPQLPLEYLPIWITELLPDPTLLPDDEGEFIELYNPNSAAVSVEGYALQTGGQTSKKYSLPNYVIGGHNYLSVYSSESGLNLSNSGGQARVYYPDEALAFETPTYDTIKPQTTWALIDDVWQFTTIITPGAVNQLPIQTVIEDSVANGSDDEVLKPCAEGWYRHPVTNRCRKIEVVTASYEPCLEGYERNPETNRCRKIVTESTLQPCASGEERNPETNRCRKIIQPVQAVAGINTNDDKSEQSSPQALSMNWLIGSALAGVAVSYGVYEWRHEIMSGIKHLRDKITAKQ